MEPLMKLNQKNIFEIENFFFQNCDTSRISKFLIQYEIFKKTVSLNGAILELGVYKGNSLLRFAIFKKIYCPNKNIYGFDTFNKFPKATNKVDRIQRKKFISDAGINSISRYELIKILKKKNCFKKVNLIPGNVMNTLPNFCQQNKKIKISFLNLDLDMYEPSKLALDLLYPKLVKNGIILLDNFRSFFGETKAVKEFCKKKKIKVNKFKFDNKFLFYIKK